MRGFEQIPWLYDAMLAASEAFGLKRWRNWLVQGAAGHTLDIGCGTGRNLPLYPTEMPVIGLDVAWDTLQRARRRAPHIPLVRGRSEALPFRDGVFDTVVSGLVFCSVADPKRALMEVSRVLKPGGSLRMLEHVRSTSSWGARWQDLIQPTWTWFAGGCHPNRNTETTVRDSGFRIDGKTRRAKRNMRRFVAVPIDPEAPPSRRSQSA